MSNALHRLSNGYPAIQPGAHRTTEKSASHGTTQVQANAQRVPPQPRWYPIQRLIEMVAPLKERRRLQEVRAATREVDKQLGKILDAISATQNKGGDAPVFRSTRNIHAALKPLYEKKHEHPQERGTGWLQHVAQRLAHGPNALQQHSRDQLDAMDRALSNQVADNPVVRQMRYAIKADLLRRELEGVALGTHVPSMGQRPLHTCTSRQLDKLLTQTKDVLASAPEHALPADVEAEIPGTVFSQKMLQDTSAAVQQAIDDVKQHTADLKRLHETTRSHPISERPIAEVIALKASVDRVIGANASGNSAIVYRPNPVLLDLGSQLDARIAAHHAQPAR